MATNIKNTTSEKYNKALSLDDRINIDKLIVENRDKSGKLTTTLNKIAAILEKDPTTISKEVRKHRSPLKQKNYDFKNPLTYCNHCNKKGTCQKKKSIKPLENTCKDFDEYICPHLKKFPWVCNGCAKRAFCSASKTYYVPLEAQDNYQITLVDSRTGVLMTVEEFNKIDAIISRGIRMGQSIEHILHSNDIPISTSTAYKYLNLGYFSVNKAQTHRMSRLHIKPHKKAYNSIILKQMKEGKNYIDFVNLLAQNPNLVYTEMDTLEGKKGGKLVLSLKVLCVQFQFYFLINDKEASTIVNKLNEIQDLIGLDNYRKIFGTILTDNGTEFTDINGIMMDPKTGEIRTNLYFCQPLQSCQKGSCEKNHELFRYVLPKGKSFDPYSEDKFTLITSHVNSYKRGSTDFSTPYEKFSIFFGKEILDKLGVNLIPPNEVHLKSELID